VRGLTPGPYDPTRLLLAGAAVSAVLGSVTGLVLTLAPADRVLRSATYWLFGGLGTPRWSAVALPALLLAVCLAWMMSRAESLDRLTLGQDAAAALGVDVARLRRNTLLAAVVLTAAAVAAAGLVGFVGLVAPHAARRFMGASHRRMLPIAALGGALLLIVADAVARTAFVPRDVPVGLLTAAVGGPLFLHQLRRSRA
jgi:iron complex transport system permease protein